MALYRNTNSHAVYIAGRLIPAGEAREVPDHLIPLDQELEAIEPPPGEPSDPPPPPGEPSDPPPPPGEPSDPPPPPGEPSDPPPPTGKVKK